MIEILKAILFGIVEGITEWLPISSTGHMILLNEFVTLDVSKEFWDMFLVVIQLGAIFAVVVLFWKLIWPFTLTSSEAVVSSGAAAKTGKKEKGARHYDFKPVNDNRHTHGNRAYDPVFLF